MGPGREAAALGRRSLWGTSVPDFWLLEAHGDTPHCLLFTVLGYGCRVVPGRTLPGTDIAPLPPRRPRCLNFHCWLACHSSGSLFVA